MNDLWVKEVQTTGRDGGDNRLIMMGDGRWQCDGEVTGVLGSHCWKEEVVLQGRRRECVLWRTRDEV
jgi:hypothetical protein